MRNHQDPITSEAQIELEHIGTLAQRERVRLERVLRCVRRGPAVGDVEQRCEPFRTAATLCRALPPGSYTGLLVGVWIEPSWMPLLICWSSDFSEAGTLLSHSWNGASPTPPR